MSVDQIKKFLDDATNYPDTAMVTIGDQQIPLGSLRQLNASERSQVADRLKEIDDQKADLKTRQASIVDLATKAQAALNAAELARDNAAKVLDRGKPGENPLDDPWLAPVKAELVARDAQINDLKSKLKETLTLVGNAATIFSEERWDNQYDSLNFGKREKKPSRQELLDLATKEGLKDRHGLPSIVKAWEKFSEADRLEDIRQAALAQGREEGRAGLMASRVPAPGVAGPGQAPTLRINPAGGDLGDIYADSMKDPELKALLEQAATIGLN